MRLCGSWLLKSSGIFQSNEGYQKAICCSELIFLSLALLHWLPGSVCPWGCNFREELSLGHSGLGMPHGGAGQLVHSPAQRYSGTMVLMQPVLPFLAQEEGAVGAGYGPGRARSLLLLLRLLKHWALGLKLGQLLRLLLRDETLAGSASWLLKKQDSGRPCGSGGRTLWVCRLWKHFQPALTPM